MGIKKTLFLCCGVVLAALALPSSGEPVKSISAQVENGAIFNSAIGSLFINTEHIGGEIEQIPLSGTYANGGFTVTLPEKVGAEYLAKVTTWHRIAESLEHFRVSDKNANYFSFARINGGNRDRAANFKLRDISEIGLWGDASVSEVSCDEKSVTFWYVDRDVSISGGMADEGSYIDLTLKKGWNKVYSAECDMTGNDKRTTKPPEGWNAKWRAIDVAEGHSDYTSALQTRFAKGTLGASGKTRPIEMLFSYVEKQYDYYAINGKSKTSAAEDPFHGTLEVGSITIGGKAGGSCGEGFTEIAGIYNLKEEGSKTSGRFIGSFTACEKDGKLSKASFIGNWVKDANGNKTPCNFGL